MPQPNLNRRGYFEQVPFALSLTEYDVKFNQGQQLQPAELFKHPFVVELVGASFDKLANTRYFALRFPWVVKIHQDRTFKDTVSFEELQELAKRCNEASEDSEREERGWLERLGGSDYLVVRSRASSSSSFVTEATSVDPRICA
jgi:DNA ligase 4